MSEPTAADLAETVERAMWNSRANSSWYLDAVAALDALVARVDTLTRERDEARACLDLAHAMNENAIRAQEAAEAAGA